MLSDFLGEAGIEYIYNFADIFHCQPLEQSTDEIIEMYHIPFKEKPSKNNDLDVWDSGEVYERLIIDVSNDDNWKKKNGRSLQFMDM